MGSVDSYFLLSPLTRAFFTIRYTVSVEFLKVIQTPPCCKVTRDQSRIA